MKRVVIPILLLFLVFSISFSLTFSFTKSLSSSTDSFPNDTIELKNYDYGSDCEFNLTIGEKLILENKDCSTPQDFKSNLNYGQYSMEIVEFNASNTSQYTVSDSDIYIVNCKGFPVVSILNDSSTNTIAIWPNISISGFACDKSQSNTLEIHSNLTFNYSNKKNVDYVGFSNTNPFSVTILFNDDKPVQLNVTLCKWDCDHKIVVSNNFKINDCSNYLPIQNPSSICPGDNYNLKLNFSNYCVNSNIKISVVNNTNEVFKKLKSKSLYFNNLVAPPQPNEGLKFYTNISSPVWKNKYYINMDDWMGIKNVTNESMINTNFDCYDKNELPVPCGYSYLINVSLERSISNTNSLDNLKNFNYTILMNVTYPNGYIDQYSKEVNGFDNYTVFGFDGYTNQTCNYTVWSDVFCFSISSLHSCFSINTGDAVSFSDKVCPTKPMTYKFPCPSLTVLKKWHDVNTISSPLHFTFGIENKNKPNMEQNYIFDINSGIDALFRLGNGIFVSSHNSEDVNVTMKVFRYVYNWSITPFNWLVNVFAKKDYVPIRIGFNQTPSQNLNGVGKISSICGGNSTCYTEVPMCGDGVCDYTAGENCRTCAKDCACGTNTKGCYGQYVKDFTDQRGCIVRFKQYEESCKFKDECDSSKGLICDHNYVDGSYNLDGHCCKPGEVWDPNTPPGFEDANKNINGTCRVVRGVHITSISINDFGNCPWSNCDFWGTVCGAKYTESISDTKITIKVHTDYAHDRVCALFATKPDICCNGGHQFYGGSTQYCINDPNSNEVTFTFRMNDRAPHSGLWSGIERRCNSSEPMLFAAYLPYQMDSSNPTYGNRTTQNNFENLLTSSGYYIDIYKPGVDVINTSDSDGNNWKSKFVPFSDWIVVNGHKGNILNDNTFAEIVEIYNSGSNSCSGKTSAGWYIGNKNVIFPKGGTSLPDTHGRFVCGGRTMKPWNDW